MDLADGTFIFLAFLIVAFFAFAYSYYTETGSGITTHPYGKIYSGAPGATGPSDVSGKDHRERVSWSRGTR